MPHRQTDRQTRLRLDDTRGVHNQAGQGGGCYPGWSTCCKAFMCLWQAGIVPHRGVPVIVPDLQELPDRHTKLRLEQNTQGQQLSARLVEIVVANTAYLTVEDAAQPAASASNKQAVYNTTVLQSWRCTQTDKTEARCHAGNSWAGWRRCWLPTWLI